MSLKDFEIGRELGKGAFGSVSIVKRIADGKSYAMKRVKISALGTKERENALNEVRILASLSHPNIIGYKEAFFDEDSKTLNIVMECADDGDLESKIQKNIKSRGNFSENDIWSYLVQTINGLKYLHDNKIMHRDLKCANIFLLKNGTLKLGDLNVSKIVKMGLAHTQTGTPYYASPEVWADKPYNYKSDIWSVACVMYELCTLKPPFRGSSLEQLYKNITKGVYDPISSTLYSKDLANVIGSMLQVNPMNRPNCDMLLSNETVIKRISAIKEGREVLSEPQPITLLNTIKMPRNMNEIKNNLPKKKRYKEEMEEAKLMNYDVNISKKPVNIELVRKENNENEMKEGKDNKREILMKENNREINREIILKENNREILMKENNNKIERNIYGKDYINNVNIGKDKVVDKKQQNNNNINLNYNYNQNINLNNQVNYNKYELKNNQQIVREMNKAPSHNNIINNREIIKKNNNVVIIRPGSAKNEVKPYPKTPMPIKHDNILNNNHRVINNNNMVNNNINHNYNILNNNGNNNRIIHTPSNPKLINNNNNNSNNNAVKILSNDRNKLDVKPVISNRPQSAKVGKEAIPNKDLNNKLNQINNINNQLIRKNLSSDRPSSPGKLNNKINNNIPSSNGNKRPVINSSPRTRSPPKEKLININNNVLIRPSSGNSNKDRLSNNNNPILLRNDKKVIIERINFDKAILQNPVRIVDPKKQNYHYNMNINQNNRNNNVVNNVRVSDNRGVINNQLGPRIVNINQRK